MCISVLGWSADDIKSVDIRLRPEHLGEAASGLPG